MSDFLELSGIIDFNHISIEIDLQNSETYYPVGSSVSSCDLCARNIDLWFNNSVHVILLSLLFEIILCHPPC